MNTKLVFGMRTKILLLCIFSILLASFLQTLFFQETASSIVYEQEKRFSINSLENMQNELYRQIKTYENSLIRVYERTDFLGDLDFSIYRDELLAKYNSLAYHLALDYFDPAQNVGAIYIYDLQDRLISVYRSANTPRFNYPEDLYEESMRNNSEKIRSYVRSNDRTMFISSYFNESRNHSIIRFVLKIYSDNSMEKIGYIVCDVNPISFIQIIKKNIYSPEQYVWLQPMGDREVINYGNRDDTMAELLAKASSDIKSFHMPADLSGNESKSVYMSLPQNKYNLVAFSLTPQYLLKKSQVILRRNMLIIALIVTIVTLFAVTLISRSLTKPLKKMVKSLELIKDGRTQVRMETVHSDEIGLLGRTINEMLDRIQGLVAHEYQLEMLLKQAEYRTLQAQVNPHFLYNSLDTMSGIALSQECRPVSILCNALANIFRYSIDMKDPLSTIDREVLHIKNYMYIMNTRMNNSIEVSMDLDQQVLHCRIPRLSLQPIVENAVNHG